MSNDLEVKLTSQNEFLSRATARIEFVIKLLGLCYILALSFGAILMFLYFFRHQFTSGGITASDALTLALLSFAFLVTAIFCICFGAVASFPIIRGVIVVVSRARRIWRSLRGKRHPDELGPQVILDWKAGTIVIVLVGVVIDALLISYGWGGSSQYWSRTVSLLALGAFPALIVFGDFSQRYCIYPRVPRSSALDRWMFSLPFRRRQMVVACTVTLAIAALAFDIIQDTSVSLFGYRKNDVSVRLKKDDFESIVARSMLAGRVINPCEPIIGSEYIINHVDVLWYKSGVQALLQVPSIPVGMAVKPPHTVFEIPNPDFKVLREVGSGKRCVEFSWKRILSDDRVSFARAAESLLSEELAWAQALGDEQYLRLLVYLPAEPLMNPISTRQLDDLRMLVAKTVKLDPSRVVVESKLDTAPKWDCAILSSNLKSHCAAANARIEASAASAVDRAER